MNNSFQLLVDSDAFVGRFYPKDVHHQLAISQFSRLEEERCALVTTNFVIAETATVLSHRSGQDLARQFLGIVAKSKLPVIYVDEGIQQEALNVFSDQKQRGTSVTDCTNVVIMRRFRIPTLFSFDKAYTKQLGVSLL